MCMYLQEHLEAYTDDFTKTKSTGQPEGIATKAWGGIGEFQNVMKRGDVWKVEDKDTGRPFYVWKRWRKCT